MSGETMANRIFTVTYSTSLGDITKEVSAQYFSHEPDFTVFSNDEDTDVFSVKNDYLISVDAAS